LHAGLAAIKGLALTDAVSDFAAESAAHGARAAAAAAAGGPGKPDGAALVHDVPNPSATTGGGGGGSAGAVSAPPRDAGVLAAAWRTASGMLAREPPPREPLTYLNALSAGAILTEPTDSERQRDITTSWSRRLAASWETARLSAILWWLDAGFALATWMGWFIPHDGTQHQHKEPG